MEEKTCLQILAGLCSYMNVNRQYYQKFMSNNYSLHLIPILPVSLKIKCEKCMRYFNALLWKTESPKLFSDSIEDLLH